MDNSGPSHVAELTARLAALEARVAQLEAELAAHRLIVHLRSGLPAAASPTEP